MTAINSTGRTPWYKDLSISAVTAGLIAVLVGYASSVAIVFQAATSAGAGNAEIASWLLALGIGMGLTCAGLSWYYRAPVITSWSTPGAALLVTGLSGLNLAEATGVFIFSAILMLITGLSGWFEKLAKRIPLPLASAMLAGILLQFGLGIFTSLQEQLLLTGAMCLCYLFCKRLLPRYAIPLVLLCGVIITMLQGELQLSALNLSLASPVWVWPEWSVSALIGTGIPLFIVTMASQNIPGMVVMRTSGYQTPISPLVSWTGLTTLLLAPLGAFSLNLAAITAAICTGEEAHPNPAKRYIAGIAAGFFYLLSGIFGAAVVALFVAFPTAMVATLAGLALLGTIGANLAAATADTEYREAAVVTLLVTVSGISFFNIASAFWGIIAGVLTLLVLNAVRKKH